MKIYLGGAMFTKAEIEYNLKMAEKLRSCGFEVYCPNENTQINDKLSADITGELIFQLDMEQMLSSNVYICQISEDSGTMYETGFMDCLNKHVDPSKYYGVIGLATDMRLKTAPDPRKSGVDNQAMYLNQFVIGGLKSSLGVYTDEDALLEALKRVEKEHEGN